MPQASAIKVNADVDKPGVRIAVTGGIGSGKSAVASRLAAHGAVVVDADRIAREVVEPGTEGLAAVVAAFGPGNGKLLLTGGLTSFF